MAWVKLYTYMYIQLHGVTIVLKIHVVFSSNQRDIVWTINVSYQLLLLPLIYHVQMIPHEPFWWVIDSRTLDLGKDSTCTLKPKNNVGVLIQQHPDGSDNMTCGMPGKTVLMIHTINFGTTGEIGITCTKTTKLWNTCRLRFLCCYPTYFHLLPRLLLLVNSNHCLVVYNSQLVHYIRKKHETVGRREIQ